MDSIINWDYIKPFGWQHLKHITLDGYINDDASHHYRIESSEDYRGRPVFYLTVSRNGRAIDATPRGHYSINALKRIAEAHFDAFGFFSEH